MYVTPEEIYNATNGGLDVILSYFPQAHPCVENQRKKFKKRGTEKTASASLAIRSGIWLVTDFGGDSKPKNCILVTMEEENCSWKEAIDILAVKFNVLPAEKLKEIIKPDISKRDATEEEEEGKYYFDIKAEFSESELKTLFADKVIEFVKNRAEKEKKDWKKMLMEICKNNAFSVLNSITYIKNRIAIITTSNENYPLFLIEGQGFQKMYQPKSLDKAYRFRYSGTRPPDYIFGLNRLNKKYQDLQQKDENEPLPEEETKKKKVMKLDNVILCSGDRDALNVAALGYNTIWLNSETAKLRHDVYNSLKNQCENVYNLPDIDSTGLRQAHELAMQYLTIKTIVLPQKLKERNDFRGNPCKDVRDYLQHFSKSSFDDLVKDALPYKFWDDVPQFNRDGEFKKWTYEFNNVQAYNFLMRNGFYRLQSQNEKEGYIYVQVVGNIVKQIRANDVKAYMNDFLKERKEDVRLRNTFYKSNQLNETSLSNLGSTEIDFTDYDKETQYIFFMNRTWKITKDGVEDFKTNEISKYVWEPEVIKHRVTKLEESFVIKQVTAPDGTIEYDIEIKNTDCLFFRYLINASRVHWQKEYEKDWKENEEEARLKYIEENKFNIAGPRLSIEEIKEQKQHLINKIYSIGYLLHRYKDPSRPWCVLAMDHKISEEGESHGGSGKSIAYKSIRYFMNSVTLDGRNRKLTDNPHIYELVSEHTDYILVDDSDKFLNFGFFFAPLTGELTVNPKNNKQFTIPFKDVPKFAITTNFTLYNIDPSTERRLLYTAFSDYYHFNSMGAYKESRSPKDEFGKNLFMDFNEAEWNLFFNTAARCLSSYLNFDKIDPPMNNVTKRNLQSQMGTAFQEWADVYFSTEGGKRDSLVAKHDAFDDCKSITGNKLLTSQRFSNALKAWCSYNRFELNPAVLKNDTGRIIRKLFRVGKDGVQESKATTTEMIYIKTTQKISEAAMKDVEPSNQTDLLLNNDKEELPF